MSTLDLFIDGGYCRVIEGGAGDAGADKARLIALSAATLYKNREVLDAMVRWPLARLDTCRVRHAHRQSGRLVPLHGTCARPRVTHQDVID